MRKKQTLSASVNSTDDLKWLYVASVIEFEYL